MKFKMENYPNNKQTMIKVHFKNSVMYWYATFEAGCLDLVDTKSIVLGIQCLVTGYQHSRAITDFSPCLHISTKQPLLTSLSLKQNGKKGKV